MDSEDVYLSQKEDGKDLKDRKRGENFLKRILPYSKVIKPHLRINPLLSLVVYIIKYSYYQSSV